MNVYDKSNLSYVAKAVRFFVIHGLSNMSLLGRRTNKHGVFSLMKILQIILFIVILPLASKCEINVETLVDQLPSKLKNNNILLENTLTSLEVLGAIHPKLIYYRIQYLNLRYSDSANTDEVKELLDQFNIIRKVEVRRKYDWYNQQLNMLKENTNAFEYLRLKKYFPIPTNLLLSSENSNVILKPMDENGVNYFFLCNETDKYIEPYSEDESYITMVQENRKIIYAQYQNWSKAIMQGTIPFKKSDIRNLLDYWYLYNDDGTISSGNHTPIALLIRDYYRILFEEKSHFNFSVFTNLEQRQITMREETNGEYLQSGGKVVIGSITTPEYLVTFGYTGKLIRYSNTLSTFTIDIGVTNPTDYKDFHYEGAFRYEISFDDLPVRLEEVNYPHLKLANISVSGIYRELAVSLWKPFPSLSFDIGYALYTEKRMYDFEYVKEFSTYIIYVDGTTQLIRTQKDDLRVQHYSSSFSAEHLLYRLNYTISDWFIIGCEYYPNHPSVKLILTL